MTRLGLLRAQAVFLGRSPAVWLTLLFLSLAWLAWLEVGTYGVTTTRVRGDAPLYEIAFLAGLAGSALATANCERSSWLLHPQGPWGRFASQGLALAGAATALQVLALGVPVALGLVHTPANLVLGALATNLHLAALALVVLAVPGPRGWRAPLLVFLAWPVSSLIPAREGLSLMLGSLLGASRHLDATVAGSSATRGDPLVDIMAVGSLTLTAALLHTGPRARHEVRNPR